MHGILPALAAKSNLRGAVSCTQQIEAPIRRIFFRDLAEFVWPIKTAFELAARTGASLRMCRYWLSGEHPAPWSAISVVLQEIIRRLV